MYKLNQSRRTKMLFATFFLLLSLFAHAQIKIKPNVYGLHVISKLKDYLDTQWVAPDRRLVDIKKIVPGVLLDLRYCQPDNFTRKVLYPPLNTTYLCMDAAKRLADVQQQLAVYGLGIKVFDAYRPYSVTQKMWAIVPDDRYAANPKFGSGHNRGTAVDLTLVKLQNQQELDMGTGFDDFSDTAHHGFLQLPDTVLQHRLLLKSVMEKAGFKPLATEWWHYSLPDAASYPLLNISFSALRKWQKK
jgi:D-alanyl-D-alanine dipeptidase